MTRTQRTLLASPTLYIPLVVFALLSIAAIVAINATPHVPVFGDFSTLFASTRAALEGHGLYRPFHYGAFSSDVLLAGQATSALPLTSSSNLNPPAAILLMSPLAWLPMREAYYVNCAVQLVLGLWVLLKLLPHFGLTSRPARAYSLAAFCLYFPVFANFYIGQVGLYLFILLGLGWLALQRGALRQAGLWFGLALTYKIFVGLIFIWLLLERRWLVLCYGALLWCLLQLFALLLFGPQEALAWLEVLLTQEKLGISWNVSLSGVMYRYLGASLLGTGLDWPYMCWALQSSGIIFTATTMLWLRAQYSQLPPSASADLGLAAAIPLMLLLSPVGWIYYFPALALSAGLIIKWSRGKPLLLLTGLILSNNPMMLTLGNFIYPDPLQNHSTLLASSLGPIDSSGSLERFAPYVVPELSTLALILIALAAARTAYKLKSAQMGAWSDASSQPRASL